MQWQVRDAGNGRFGATRADVRGLALLDEEFSVIQFRFPIEENKAQTGRGDGSRTENR
jgi:hypothetical protein